MEGHQVNRMTRLTFLFLLGWAAAAAAGTPQEVFDRASNIVDGAASQITNGTLFCVARVRGNARSLAYAALNETMTRELVGRCIGFWPEEEGVPRALQRELFIDYVKLQSGFREILPGLKTVYRTPSGHREGDCDYVQVWGISLADLTNQIPTWAEVKALAEMPESYPYPDLNPLAVLQIVPAEKRPALVAEFARRVRLAHGADCENVILGRRPGGFSLIEYSKVNRRFLRGMDFRQLFNLLSTLPYHPAILAEMADRYRKAGLEVAARLAASRGKAMPFIDSASAQACRALLGPDEAAADAEFPITFGKAEPFAEAYPLLKPAFMKATFRGSALMALSLWGRPFPGGSTAMPDDPDFHEGERLAATTNGLFAAYISYRKSVERQLTYEACLRAGKLAREAERPHEAIVLLTQALTISPDDRAVWRELADIAASVDEAGLAKFCRENAIRRIFR
jgi:tetratricopeptide (TPR) repeat protein